MLEKQQGDSIRQDEEESSELYVCRSPTKKLNPKTLTSSDEEDHRVA